MLVVTSENFEQEVLNAQGPVLVDFFADWCMPCKMFAPILEDAQEELGNRVKIVKINIDESIQLAQKYRVMSILTLKLFTGEEEPRATFVGAMSQEELVDWLAENGVE
jgi:thioredoxin 1